MKLSVKIVGVSQDPKHDEWFESLHKYFSCVFHIFYKICNALMHKVPKLSDIL